MDRLRTPFFILAIVLIVIAILIEVGTALPGVLPSNSLPVQSLLSSSSELSNQVDKLNQEQPGAIDRLSQQGHPPGLGIPYMALLDCIVLLTVTLMGLPLLL